MMDPHHSCINHDDDDDDDDTDILLDHTIAVPDHFLCPLTLEIMKHPLQHKQTGHTFERKAILEWIYVHGYNNNNNNNNNNGVARCPLTRRPLHPSDFIEHVALQEEIAAWKHCRKQLTHIVNYRYNNSGSSPYPNNNKDETATATATAAHVNQLMNVRHRVLAKLQQKRSHQQQPQQQHANQGHYRHS